MEKDPSSRMKFNVGGKLFETTPATIGTTGHAAAGRHHDPLFIDRDPELFAHLLSTLRSNRLPSTTSRFTKRALINEAIYYGVESRLRSAIAPWPFVGIDAGLATTIIPASHAFPTAIAAGSHDGSLWIAHGGQISAYDWSLTHFGTIRTHLDDITSIRRLSPEVAAIGSLDSPGLHFYEISSGHHRGSTHWSDPSDLRVYKARVTAIVSDADMTHPIFAAFEAPHKENCITAVDRATLQVVAQFGCLTGSSSKVASAGKLAHLPNESLVFSSAVSSGAFGYAGYMRLWDPRTGAMVWETCEPGGSGGRRFGDAFADADVGVEEGAIYKVCWKSGDVAMADMRRLGDDPWVYLKDPGVLNPAGGEGSILHCYKKQVFVGKVEGLEVWSQLDGQFRRNYVDAEEDAKRGNIRIMEGGGDRFFLSRERMEGVEVWESSELAGAIAVS
ncbi:putative chromatin remodeling & transcription regulator BTB-POZ family [Dioscorea sansibarensis]